MGIFISIFILRYSDKEIHNVRAKAGVSGIANVNGTGTNEETARSGVANAEGKKNAPQIKWSVIFVSIPTQKRSAALSLRLSQLKWTIFSRGCATSPALKRERESQI